MIEQEQKLGKNPNFSIIITKLKEFSIQKERYL